MIDPWCLDETDLAYDLQPHVQRVARGQPLIQFEHRPRAPAIMLGHSAIVLWRPLMKQHACAHIETITAVIPPQHRECDECVKIRARWVHLRTCQACGVTLCCDSSPNKHASAHARSA